MANQAWRILCLVQLSFRIPAKKKAQPKLVGGHASFAIEVF